MKTHNTKRYGEKWPEHRIEKGLEILEKLKNWIILSGGWAWHFMSVNNHQEYKHAHDHKDIDLFVEPKNVAQVMQILQQNDFKKVWTRYDHLPSPEKFRRYEKTDWLPNGTPYRVTIDFFEKREIETVNVEGWRVVNPKTLLGFYNSIHSSDSCWAVKASQELFHQGINPIKHPLLSKNPLEK